MSMRTGRVCYARALFSALSCRKVHSPVAAQAAAFIRGTMHEPSHTNSNNHKRVFGPEADDDEAAQANGGADGGRRNRRRNHHRPDEKEKDGEDNQEHQGKAKENLGTPEVELVGVGKVLGQKRPNPRHLVLDRKVEEQRRRNEEQKERDRNLATKRIIGKNGKFAAGVKAIAPR